MIEGINDLAKKYELSEADIERVLHTKPEIEVGRLANGAALMGQAITAHKGHVFGACRSVRSSVTLGAGARFMRATYKLALMDLIAEAKAPRCKCHYQYPHVHLARRQLLCQPDGRCRGRAERLAKIGPSSGALKLDDFIKSSFAILL